MNKKLILICTLILLVIGSAYFLVKVGIWLIDSNKTRKNIEIINSNVRQTEVELSDNTELINPQPKTDIYWDFVNMPMLSVNLDNLTTINSDTVGWLEVKGTNINYPFVQTTNNDYYLKHSFDKTTNGAGWVFLDYRNNITDFSRNTIIYAHSRAEGTMFGTLKDTLKDEWYENTKNHIIRVSTKYENTMWQIFSIYKIPTTSDYLKTSFKNALEWQEFIKLITTRSIFDFDAYVADNAQIITLSTCSQNDKKIVVHAKLIKREKR